MLKPESQQGDHLGSAVGMTNATDGNIANSLARYDPFGNYRTWPGSNVNPLILDRGFTGHVHDNTGEYPTQNVGLIYMNARYYLPEVGRFISADTIVPEAGNPQSYNRYAYTNNNPVNYTDPTGHLSKQEIQDYFGFNSQQEMEDAGWDEDLAQWLWDSAVTWGNVFTYNDGAGEAMLVLFEAQAQDSGLYRGGFYGLNGNRAGLELAYSNITNLEDHTASARALEKQFLGNYRNLPRFPYGDGYNAGDPSTYYDIASWENAAFLASIITAPSGYGGAKVLLKTAVDAWKWKEVLTVSAFSVEVIATAKTWGDGTTTYPVINQPDPFGNAPISIGDSRLLRGCFTSGNCK